jgi:hypothetical protein
MAMKELTKTETALSEAIATLKERESELAELATDETELEGMRARQAEITRRLNVDRNAPAPLEDVRALTRELQEVNTAVSQRDSELAHMREPYRRRVSDAREAVKAAAVLEYEAVVTDSYRDLVEQLEATWASLKAINETRLRYCASGTDVSDARIGQLQREIGFAITSAQAGRHGEHRASLDSFLSSHRLAHGAA